MGKKKKQIKKKEWKIETKLFFKEREKTQHIANEIPLLQSPIDLLNVISDKFHRVRVTRKIYLC